MTSEVIDCANTAEVEGDIGVKWHASGSPILAVQRVAFFGPLMKRLAAHGFWDTGVVTVFGESRLPCDRVATEGSGRKSESCFHFRFRLPS